MESIEKNINFLTNFLFKEFNYDLGSIKSLNIIIDYQNII